MEIQPKHSLTLFGMQQFIIFSAFSSSLASLQQRIENSLSNQTTTIIQLQVQNPNVSLP